MVMSKISSKSVWILTAKPTPTANALSAFKAMNSKTIRLYVKILILLPQLQPLPLLSEMSRKNKRFEQSSHRQIQLKSLPLSLV